MKVIISISIISMMFIGAWGLKCYQCIDSLQPDCGSSGQEKYAKDCDENGVYPPGTKWLCLNTVTKNNFNEAHVLAKSCFPDPNTDVCKIMENMYPKGDLISCDVCNTDLCN